MLELCCAQYPSKSSCQVVQRLVCLGLTAGQSRGSAGGPSTSGSKGAPRHAVLLRWGGMLSVLDLSRGAELMLADEVRATVGTLSAIIHCLPQGATIYPAFLFQQHQSLRSRSCITRLTMQNHPAPGHAVCYASPAAPRALRFVAASG